MAYYQLTSSGSTFVIRAGDVVSLPIGSYKIDLINHELAGAPIQRIDDQSTSSIHDSSLPFDVSYAIDCNNCGLQFEDNYSYQIHESFCKESVCWICNQVVNNNFIGHFANEHSEPMDVVLTISHRLVNEV